MRAVFAPIAAVLFLSGCGAQINTLRKVAQATDNGLSGVPPDITSFQINESSPTKSSPLSLQWGVEIGSHTQYCILENMSDSSFCIWKSGSLPSTYTDSSPDGSLALTAFLKNSYGTSSAVPSNTVTLDRTPPSLASATVGNSDPTNDPIFSLSFGAVTNAPYSQYCILENDTAVGDCSWTTATLPSSYTVSNVSGSKALSIWLKDVAGNVSTRVTTAAITYDNTVAAVAITSPAAGSYVNIANAAAFTLSGTCSENARNVVISGAASATLSCTGGGWSKTFDLSAVAQGSLTFNADFTNSAGSVATQATRSFTKDTVAPTVTITTPTSSNSINAANVTTISVSGTCSDNGAAVSVATAGLTTATPTCTSNAFSTSFDFTSVADGSVTITASQTDVGTNTGSASVTLTKDATVPTLASVTITNSSPTSTTNYALTYGSLSETIAKYCILQNDTTVAHCSSAWVTASSLPGSFTVSSVSGANVLTVWVADAAGNVSAGTNSNSVTFTANPITIAPASTTLSRTYSYQIIEGQRGGAQATVLSDGRILVTGGCNTYAWFNTVRIYDPTTDKWLLQNPMMYNRCFHQSILLPSGKVMVIGGTKASGTATNTVELFDPSTGNWSVLSSMTSARTYHSATLYSGGTKVFVAGGHNGSAASGYSTTEIYDIATDTWSAGPSITSVRFDHQAIMTAAGDIYLIGGQSAASTYLSSVQKFVPNGGSGTISSMAAMASQRTDFAAVLLSTTAESGLANGEGILVAGGYNGSNLSSIAMYDVTADSWTTRTKSLGGTNRYVHGYKYASDGQVLFFGGSSTKTDLYNANADTIVSETAITTARPKSTFAPLPNGDIAVIYGDVGNIGHIQTAYRRSNNTWRTLAAVYFNSDHYGGVAGITLSDGRVMYCYAQTSVGEIKNCMVYEPSKNGVWVTAPTSQFRGASCNTNAQINPRLVQLTDGRVMVVGGLKSGCSQANNDAEIYDFSTDTWTTTAAMPKYIANGNAVALSGNKVVVFGFQDGTTFNNAGNLAQDVYIYDVGTNAWTDLTATHPIPAGVWWPNLVVTSGGRIFLLGGADSSDNAVSTVYEFDPSTYAWTTRASMIEARQYFASTTATIGGVDYIYAWSGCNGNNCAGYSTTLERYNLATNPASWSYVTPGSGAYADGDCTLYSPGDQAFWNQDSYTTDITRVDINTNNATTPINGVLNYSGGTATNCARAGDGRLIFFNPSVDGVGSDSEIVRVVNVVPPVTYTASGGDGNYLWSLLSGGALGNFYEAARMWIPLDTLPTGTATIQAQDGNGTTATATATK